MPAEKHLCYVNSGPTPPMTNDLWREFYTTEHLPDAVNSGCAVRALFYEESSTPFTAANNTKNFLAVYQTEYSELMKAPCHHKIRTTSDLFSRANSTTDLIARNADFEVRNYELIQEYDPLGVGQTPSPQLLTVETQPQDAEDSDRWCREEHLDTLRGVPGYHRSLRYKVGPQWELASCSPPGYLAIHEVDDINAFRSEEANASSRTPWSQRQLGDAEALVVRGWKLVSALGY